VGHVDQLEVVDLNPDIEGVAEVFARENLDVLHHPNYRKVVNDGRNALLLSPKRYSLIISDATNPKMFDSWTLYSQEFYELVARRLEPGGVFAQWVLIPLPGDSIKVTLNTFRSVFPHTSFWCIYGSSQCLMLATPERLQIDYAALVQRLEPVLGPSGLREYGVDSPEKFLSFFLLGEDHLAHLLAGHSTLNTDDLPYAQFQVEQDDNGIQASLDLVRHQEPILTYLTNSGPDLVALAARMAVYEDLSRRLHLGFLTGDATHDREAEKVAADAGLIDANVRSALHYGPEKQRYFEERVRSHPDDANAHNTLGFIRWRLGDHDGARRSFQTAIALDPAYPMARANLARLLVDMGAFDDAVTALLEVRATHPTKTVLEMTRRQLDIVHLLRRQARRPGDAAPLRDLALAYYEDGQLRRSLEALEASLAADPRDLAAWAHLGRLLEAHGFPEQAADAYRRLAKLVPGDPALRARADELDSLRDPDRRRGWMASRVALRPAPAPGDHPETCDRALAAWHASGLETRVERTDLVTAATLYEASLATRPDDLHAWVDAALLREILGDRSRAMELWRGANDIAPEWPDPGHHLRRLELLGRLEGMAAGDPERPLVLEELAAHLRALARGEEAVIYLRQAVAADPARARTWAALAAALEEVGLYDEAAAAALRSAVAASPPGQDVPTRG
jgi:tetratricopeptide (TPR) repeat protein